MPAVMNVMGVDHPVKVGRTVLRSPLQSLMDNEVVENQVKDPVKQYSQSNGKYIGILIMNPIHE
jgi:hypothetical protein